MFRMSDVSSRNASVKLACLLASWFVLCGPLLASAGLAIDNPYAQASWKAEHQHKANFHTHSKVSDGRLYPHEVIDSYKKLGYSALALTDHNKVTYPWTTLKRDRGEGFENRDPNKVGMKDIEGNELSSHHHLCSFFCDQKGTKTETDSLDGITKKGGLAILNHPGRYKKGISWYTNLYARYDVLVGLEIYNQGDRYPNDRKKWDAILMGTMPERPVWGVSNDDMHSPGHMGRNWSVLLIDKVDESGVRTALKNGCFYFVYAPKGHAGPKPPAILGVTVDQKAGSIALRTSDAESVEWISNGVVVGEGETLTLSKVKGLGGYVRAMLYGAEGAVAGTQPFGIRR